MTVVIGREVFTFDRDTENLNESIFWKHLVKRRVHLYITHAIATGSQGISPIVNTPTQYPSAQAQHSDLHPDLYSYPILK